jgi:copper homeostasis protein
LVSIRCHNDLEESRVQLRADAPFHVGLQRRRRARADLELEPEQLDAFGACAGTLGMQKRHVLEICVESLGAALAAERGGAHRIELCSDLWVGGVTPDPELVKAARQHLRLPIHSMVRPRAGDFCYSNSEFETMERSIDTAKELEMNGVVLGLLDTDGRVDVPRTKSLVVRAHPLPVTFHRAFDESLDLWESLDDVLQTGVTRILTSGGARTVSEGIEIVAQLIKTAGERIIVMPGSGIHAGNILEVAKHTRAQEFHSGLSTVLPDGRGDHRNFETQVRNLAERLASLS